jgi:hypothetical protein
LRDRIGIGLRLGEAGTHVLLSQVRDVHGAILTVRSVTLITSIRARLLRIDGRFPDAARLEIPTAEGDSALFPLKSVDMPRRIRHLHVTAESGGRKSGVEAIN